MTLEDLLILTGLSASLAVGVNVVGAAVYDFRQIYQKRQENKHPYARRYRNRPLVSIVVPTSNSQPVIERVLASILDGSYRKTEIIVIDSSSTDGTKAIVKQFQANHPDKKIKWHAKRSPSTRQSAVLSALRHVNGQLVVVIDPSYILNEEALRAAVRHFNAKPETAGLGFNLTVSPAFSTLGLFQRIEQILHYRVQKVDSLISTTYAYPLEPAIYTKPTIKKLLRPNTLFNNDISYGSDVIAYIRPASSIFSLFSQRYSRQSRRIRTIPRQLRRLKRRKALALLSATLSGMSVLFAPLAVTYFLYLAIDLHEPDLFIASYLALSIFVAFAIWGDDQLKFRQKAAYSLFIPLTYGLFYLLSFARYAAILGASASALKERA
jgi:glycosyltransferase involved in cell wall biosynthesis